MPWGHKRGREVSLKVEREVVTMEMNLELCMGLQAEGLAFAKKQDAWKEMRLAVGTVESFLWRG